MKKAELEKLIDHLKNIDDDNIEYKQYLESLNLLAQRLLVYYTPDEYNKFKKMTQEEHEEIETLFNDAQEKSDFYMNTGFIDEENEIVRDFKKNLNDMIHNKFLKEYYEDFKKVSLDSSNSYNEELDKTKNRSVGNITRSNIVNDGLFKKDNLTVDYNNEKVSGTFIYKTDYDAEKQIDDLINEFSNIYPEYKEYFTALNDSEMLNELGDIDNKEILGPKNEVVNFFDSKNLKVNSISRFDEYKNQLEFLNANAQFILKLRPILKNIKTYTIDLNINKGSNLDTRNVAVSDIAKALNQGQSIPNSKGVAIEKNENGEISYSIGTFVENHKGLTLKEIDIKNPLRDIKIDSFDTKEAKKSLANLQIIDYICGNHKRGINDLSFEFDPKTNKLISVQGINNEKSFTNKNVKDDDYTELEDINVIDEEMATKVLAFKESEFKTLLISSGLDNDEIEASWKRVVKLQTLIKEKTLYDENEYSKDLENNKLVIVNSDSWDKISLKDLAHEKENIFSKAVDAHFSLTETAMKNNELEEKYNILKFTYNNKLLSGEKYLDEAKRNAPLFGTSKRFSNIIKTLNEYNNTLDMDKKTLILDKLKENINVYNKEKIEENVLDENGNLLKNLTGKDLARINLVKDLSEFTKTITKLNDELKTAKDLVIEDEKNVDEINSTFRRGKYRFYAKCYKDDDGKVKINSNIMEREKQNCFNLSTISKKIVSISNGVDLDKNKVEKEKYDAMKEYLDTSIDSYKKQLKTDYEHGVIPKEYYDYKMDRYDKKILTFEDEKEFVSTDPQFFESFDSFRKELKNKLEFDIPVDKDEEIIVHNEINKEDIVNDDSEALDMSLEQE